MKIYKFDKSKNSTVDRKIISKFGEAIYSCPEIRSVFIKVNFNDGSSIGFKRDEDEDDFQDFFEKLENKEVDDKDSLG
ncbi:MAG: hypothetical protein AABX54_02825 [Nanoarchaeota archaeon]